MRANHTLPGDDDITNADAQKNIVNEPEHDEDMPGNEKTPDDALPASKPKETPETPEDVPTPDGNLSTPSRNRKV